MTQTQHVPAQAVARLGENNYGKAEVKLMKVFRDTERHEIRELQVRVAMTENAQRFVGATTFQALSGEAVRTSLWDEHAEAAMGHIELARWASVVVVAPATANTIARLTHGFADDLVSTLCLATEAPIAVAPAMNRVMWANAATQANVATLPLGMK